MARPAQPPRNAYLVDTATLETLDLMGAVAQFIVGPDFGDTTPFVMRGTIPPGGIVPMHSHPDPETFCLVSGEMEALSVSDTGFEWLRLRPGDVFHVPPSARHGFRNPGHEPAVSLITSTATIGRFFREVGVPVAPDGPPPAPPSRERVERFLRTAERYGHWNATPEENARVGLHVPPPS
ncbi:MAG TPA: cupin domain-containing protein [Vicinamibacterales bacterium]